jgi:FlaG/FlaF family flagellin (archaellin)
LRNITKIRRSVRAISPVISVLLMIAIAVVASLVAYAWVMGYMNFQTGKAGQSILIQSYAVSPAGSTMYVYVQNNGQGSVVFDPNTCAYINDAGRTAVVDDTTLDEGQTTLITVSGLSLDITKAVKVKIVTTSGTFAEVNGVPPISGGASHVPTAYADSYSVVRNTVLNIAAPGVLANDHYVTIAEKVSDPSQGTLDNFNADGSFQYTAPDAVVVDSFTYKGTDGTTTSNTVTVTINVVNELPALASFDVVADAGAKVQNVPFGITVTAKDQYDSIFTSWSSSNTLVASFGSIDPTNTGAFTAGVWTGTVTLSDAGSITITTTGGGKTGASDPITVLAQYTVTFSAGDNGQMTNPTAGDHVYTQGNEVTISATADTDYHFSHWTKTGAGITIDNENANPATATINGDGTITANFAPDAPQQFTVTFQQTGLDSSAGSETVVTVGGVAKTFADLPYSVQVDVGSSVAYSYGSTISGGAGKQFVITNTPTPASPVTDAATVTATYKTQYYLTTSTNFGTVSPSGWYDSGSTVTISATAPSAGSGERYVWNGWTGTGSGSYTGTNNPATNAVTMNAPITETASWTHQYEVTFAVSPSGAGTTTPSIATWYDAGVSGQAISASENTGYGFSEWTCDPTGSVDFDSSTSASTTMTVNAPSTVTANFEAEPVTITRSPSSSYGDWSNENNAYADGGNYATSSGRYDDSTFYDYGFTIPSGATVTQVRVRLDAWHDYYGDDDVSLEVYDGSWHTYGTISLSGSENTYWRDVTSLSSGGWTASEVNGIQVRVSHVRDGYSTDNIYLDWIPIEVTYTP